MGRKRWKGGEEEVERKKQRGEEKEAETKRRRSRGKEVEGKKWRDGEEEAERRKERGGEVDKKRRRGRQYTILQAKRERAVMEAGLSEISLSAKAMNVTQQARDRRRSTRLPIEFTEKRLMKRKKRGIRDGAL